MCADCHRNAHAIFTNKELAREFSTVEALLAHPTFAKATTFLRKQDPSRRCRMVRTNDRKRKSRSKFANLVALGVIVGCVLYQVALRWRKQP
jgi:hypothetical protein